MFEEDIFINFSKNTRTETTIEIQVTNESSFKEQSRSDVSFNELPDGNELNKSIGTASVTDTACSDNTIQFMFFVLTFLSLSKVVGCNTDCVNNTIQFMFFVLTFLSLSKVVGCNTDCVSFNEFSASFVGPDLILHMNVSFDGGNPNQCSRELAKHSVIWEGGPENKRLTNGNVSLDETKYQPIQTKESYDLLIKDVTEGDIKSLYKPHVWFSSKEVYIENLTIQPDDNLMFNASCVLSDMSLITVLITVQGINLEPTFEFLLNDTYVQFDVQRQTVNNRTAETVYTAKYKATTPICKESLVVNYNLLGFGSTILKQDLNVGCHKTEPKNWITTVIAVVCVTLFMLVSILVIVRLGRSKSGNYYLGEYSSPSSKSDDAG